MSKYTPTLNNVLVQPDEKEKESAGGIILPDSDTAPVNRGTVVAVGPEVEHLSPGQLIIYNQYGGVDYELDGEKLLVMSIHDIVLTVS